MRKNYFIVILISVTLAVVMSHSRWSEVIDDYFYDLLLEYVPSANTDTPALAVIAIDDHSLSEIKAPLVLWIQHFSTLIDALTAAGAKAIIFDVIPAVSLDEFVPGLDSLFMKSINNAKRSGTKIILGTHLGVLPPLKKFSFVASDIGFIDLQNENDGVIRKQKLLITMANNPKSRKQSAIRKSLSLIAAMTYSETTKNPKEYVCEQLKICGDKANEPIIWIDYRLNQELVETYSFHSILNQSLSADTDKLRQNFKDKVILLGPTSDKLNDIHVTPFNPLLHEKKYTPGIIVHAMATLSILSSFHLASISDAFKIWGSIIIALLVAVLVLFTSPLRSIALLLLSLAICGILWIKAFSSYIVIPFSPLIFGFILPTVIAGSYLYAVEYQQLKILRKYFKSYVSTEVMEEIIQHPERVNFDGSIVNVSIMFVDIRNFSTISEQINPTEVLHGLNTYLAEMTNAITSANGYVNRYLGDGILAIFGAPNKLPKNGAVAAVEAGLEILKRLEALNKQELFPGVSKIKIGIGIHTGQAIIGNVGSPEKMDYTIIGDSANLASRVESLTKKYNTPLLISDATYEFIKDQMVAKYIDCIKLKGREKKVTIYSI